MAEPDERLPPLLSALGLLLDPDEDEPPFTAGFAAETSFHDQLQV